MPIVLDLSKDEEIINLKNRVSELEKLIKTSTHTKVVKSGDVRRIFGNISKQALYSLVKNDVLHPFQFYPGGDYFYYLDEINSLLQKYKR